MTVDVPAADPGAPGSELRLPISGIGVDGHALVIAPPGHPAIRLDARTLDRIELVTRSSQGPRFVAGMAVLGAVTALAGLVPGGLWVGVPLIGLASDRLLEARRRGQARELLLVLGQVEVALHIAEGPAAARAVCDRLTGFTRSASLQDAFAYEDAKRRLHAAVTGAANPSRPPDALAVGGTTVEVMGQTLMIGGAQYGLEVVRRLALSGENLDLGHGRQLQAALGLLVIAAHQRAHAGEDIEGLRQRIAAYEAWAGRTAGR